MPKLYEYPGIIVFFYSNKHLPIHVHARKGEREVKATFRLEEGIIKETEITNVAGKDPLQPNELKDLSQLLQAHGEDMVQSWVRYFVYHLPVNSVTIHQKLKP